MASCDSHLRYLDATRVDTPVGTLAVMSLISPSDKNVGTLDGVIIDPIEWQVRYFVVKSHRWWTTRRYLLPVTPAQIDSERRGLHVELEPDDLQRLPKLHADRFPPFSDEDLISSLFSPRAA
jgi:hypothetical protein